LFWLSLLVIWRFGKFYFLPLLKNKLCVKVRRVGGGVFFQQRFWSAGRLPNKACTQMKWEVKGKEKDNSNSTWGSVKQQCSATAFKKAA